MKWYIHRINKKIIEDLGKNDPDFEKQDTCRTISIQNMSLQ